MRRLAANVAFGLEVAIFALVVVLFSPVLLIQFGVDWTRDRIEKRWPDSERARRVGAWLRLLGPIILLVLLNIVLWRLVLHVRALADQRLPPSGT